MEDFLDDLNSPEPLSAIAQDGYESPPKKTGQQIEDDLFDFLDTPTLAPSLATDKKPNNESIGFSITSPSMDESQDFLSWLEETPSSTSKPASFIDTNTSSSDIVLPKSMDNFFDEVFGTDTAPSPSASSKSSAFINSKMDSILFENKLNEIIQSSFPDVHLLKQIIFEHGYVPVSLRGYVWLLILSGNCSEDDEARTFNSNTAAQVTNKQTLFADCNLMVKNLPNKLELRDPERISRDMSDILVLYCLRRNLEYRSIFSKLLLPLVVSAEPAPKALASSCFYAIVSSFAPLVNLHGSALEQATNTVHSWLRLLLSYHSPALVQHLDRVLPGWEQPVTSQAGEHHKTHSNLDELEKELGLLDEALAEAPGAKSGGVIDSAHKSRVSTGCVPTHWVSGLFTGSVPADQSAVLLDWAILNNERYAGLYFTVALLEIFSQSLLKMTGAAIRQWLDDVACNSVDWFAKLSVTLDASAATAIGSEEADVDVDTWTTFTRGWIHATAVLMNSTPQAFKEAVHRVEDWANDAAERQRLAAAAELNLTKQQLAQKSKGLSAGLDDYQHGDDIPDDIFGDEAGSSAVQQQEEEDDDNEDDETDGQVETGGAADKDNTLFGAGKVNLMAQFRRLSMQFQGDNASVGEAAANNASSLWAIHESKSKASTMCLWASAEEVVPCISSNRRRPAGPEDILLSFRSAVVSVAQKEGQLLAREVFNVCFPLVAVGEENSSAKPFFFGIDCRSDEEKRVGQFPKAFAMAPSILTDTEEIAKLLQVVEPMAACAHICIIGAGEDFLRWEYKNSKKGRRRKAGSGDAPELTAAIAEQGHRLDAVALFFLKKAFRHVSVLEGGFVAAAKYLQRADSSLSLLGALVDVDKVALESLLGIPSSAPQKVSVMTRIENALLSEPKQQTHAPTPSAVPAGPTTLMAVGSFISSFAVKNPSSTNSTPDLASGVPAERSSATSSAPPSRSESPSVNTSATPAASVAVEPAAGVDNTNATVNTAKQWLSGWGKKISAASETIKKNVSAIAVPASVAPAAAPEVRQPDNRPAAPTQKAFDFVIDDEEEDESGHREFADTDKIAISRTDIERAQALALHKLAGLQKYDKVTISRAELPGAVLFPCLKIKEVFVDEPSAANTADQTEHAAEDVDGSASTSVPSEPPKDAPSSSVATVSMENSNRAKKEVQVHRFLVVARERFLVLDSNGEGIGSTATVKSNHHLTELIKMTFRKKDPELVTLHFLNNLNSNITKTKQYRVSKRSEFIEALQKNMQRFK